MSSIKYKEQVRQALQAMPRMTADEFYSQMSHSIGTPLKYIKMTDKTEPEAIPPLSSGDIAHTLCDYGTTKLLYTYPSDSNVQLNNFPVSMRFRSKTEAIEKLCLQVFGATPVYETDVEDFKAETPEEITKLETELNKAKEQLVAERELANRLEEENAAAYLRRWAKAQERAIDAECERDEWAERWADLSRASVNDICAQRERDEFKNRALEAMDDYVTEVLKNERLERALKEAWYIMDTIEGNDAVDEWQNKYSKYIESDYISCLDCDALASHGVNDGPCEKHKKD